MDKKKKDKKIKYTGTIIGASFSGIICGALMAKHGAQMLLVEKNNFINEFIFSDSYLLSKNSKELNYDFYGFSINNYYYDLIINNELKLKNSIEYLIPKNKIKFIFKNISYIFLNENLKNISYLNNEFPLERNNFVKLNTILERANSNNVYILEIKKKYNSAYDFLNIFFKNNKILFTIFSIFSFYCPYGLKNIDTSYFIKVLINHYYSSIAYPKCGISSFIKTLLREIIISEGTILLNTKITDSIINKDKLVRFNAISKNKKN